MARKRMYNTVRTDTLESRIAHYRVISGEDSQGERALRWLAKDIGAPISDEAIDRLAKEREQYYFGDAQLVKVGVES